MVWFRAFRLTSEHLHYETLWSDRKVALDDLERAELRGGIYTEADRNRPLYRLELFPCPESGEEFLYANCRVFRGRDLDELFDYLPLVEAEADEPED